MMGFLSVKSGSPDIKSATAAAAAATSNRNARERKATERVAKIVAREA